MKKTVVLILGIICAAVAVYYFFLKKSDSINSDDNHSASTEKKTDIDVVDIQNTVDAERNEAAETIKERHKVAADEIKKSVDNVFNNNEDDRFTKNSGKIKTLLDDIDNL